MYAWKGEVVSYEVGKKPYIYISLSLKGPESKIFKELQIIRSQKM